MGTKICLCTMCGIPGSGKSSFCERLNQDLINLYLVIHVDYDKILLSSKTDRIQLHQSLSLQNHEATGDGSLMKISRHQILKLVEMVIQYLKSHGTLLGFETVEGINNINQDIRESFLRICKKQTSKSSVNLEEILVLIDDNMYFNSMRYDFFKLARQQETGFCEIYMDSSVEKALERNGLREGRGFVGGDIIRNMAQRMEPPDPVKNQWEKYSITVNTEAMTTLVLPTIQEAFAHPVQPVSCVDEKEQALSQIACSRSLIHQADLILRKCVAKTIANGKKDSKDIRLLSMQASEVKKNILTSLESGDTNVCFAESFYSIEDASKDENCDLYKCIHNLFTEKIKM